MSKRLLGTVSETRLLIEKIVRTRVLSTLQSKAFRDLNFRLGEIEDQLELKDISQIIDQLREETKDLSAVNVDLQKDIEKIGKITEYVEKVTKYVGIVEKVLSKVAKIL